MFDLIAVAMGIIVIVLGVAFMIWSHFSKYSHNEWFCNKMGWHLAPTEQGFDGCSSTGTCPRCNKAVLLDSQGNWF